MDARTPALVTRTFTSDDVPVDGDAVLSFLRVRRSSPAAPSYREMVADTLRRYRTVPAPCYRYTILEVTRVYSDPLQVILEGGTMFHGSGPVRLLRNARLAACFILTLGEAVDDAIDALGRIDATEAFVLDGVASAFAQGVLRLLETELDRVAGTLESERTRRLAPGYPGWDLSGQQPLFSLLRAGEIGMKLSPSCFMHPQKTLSGIYGLIPRAPRCAP